MNQKQGVFLMKTLTICLLFFSCLYSHGFGVNPLYSQQKKQASQSVSEETAFSAEETLIGLRVQIKQYIDSLAVIFLDKNTSVKNQIEILHELKSLADMNGEIVTALNQMSQKGVGYEDKETSLKDEKISLWAKSQSELIKRKQLELDELEEAVENLKAEFYVNLAVDGVVIVGGSVLMLIPAGQSVSILLFGSRLALTAKRLKALGAVISVAGGVGVGSEVYYYLSEENQEVLSFIFNLVFKDDLSKEIFQLLTSVNESDKYLAINLFKSVDEEVFINNLLSAIQNNKFSPQARIASVNSLIVFKDIEDEYLRKEIIDTLKEVINTSQLQDLRQASVRVLGAFGEENPELIDYLKKLADGEEYDVIRLTSLLQVGRNKSDFDESIKALAKWLKDRDHKTNPLNIKPEIPQSFLESLLSEREEATNNQIIVVRGFILSGILDVETKLTFSKVLISWNKEPESEPYKAIDTNQEVLEQVWADPIADTILYIDKLYKETRSEDNEQAFEYLKVRVNKLKTEDTSFIILEYFESMIQDFATKHPEQKEIANEIEDKIYVDTAIDIAIYIEKLSEQMSRNTNNKPAIEFLQSHVRGLKEGRIPIILQDLFIEEIRLDMDEKFKKKYIEQVEIAQKVENFLNFYQEVLNSLKN